MVRTSTAEKHNFVCPACGDELRQDNTGRGYVAHVSNPRCLFEKGERDDLGPTATPRRASRPVFPAHEPADGVRVCGYSERGIFNALLYELEFCADPVGALREFLALISVPGGVRDFSDLQGAEVLVEQSLSDFGDADVVLLLHGSDWHCAVFVEGKVKPSQVGRWSIDAAWSEFLARKGGRLDSSNLFTQLYHKARFVAGLRQGGASALQRGLGFPECSAKTIRKLGSNPVVRRAASMIETYLDEALYIALVPDSIGALAGFFSGKLLRGPGEDITGWDTAGWGYLTWRQVEDFCRQQDLKNTLRVFEFNTGQIY